MVIGDGAWDFDKTVVSERILYSSRSRGDIWQGVFLFGVGAGVGVGVGSINGCACMQVIHVVDMAL